MTALNKRIADIPIPRRMSRLPISDEGFPVPWFVPFLDGKPEFRGADPVKLRHAISYHKCWLCGEPCGKYMTFVIGPMCAITRTTSEPPCHHACATYAVLACPFLTQPRMRRNERHLPEHAAPAAGIAIQRNPGVTALWTTNLYKLIRVAPEPGRVQGGVLFRIGDPTNLEFYGEGRHATYDEVMQSINTGIPILMAEAEKDGPEGVAELGQYIDRALSLVAKMGAQ